MTSGRGVNLLGPSAEKAIAVSVPGVTLLKATPRDVLFLREMDRLATDASPTVLLQIYRPAWDAHQDALWRNFSEWGRIGFVAWMDGVRAGGLFLSSHTPDNQGVEALKLVMGVVPAFRRRGVGRALLEAASIHAGAAGSPYLALHVDPRNLPAQSLYLAFGFRNHIKEAGLWEMRLPLPHSLGR